MANKRGSGLSAAEAARLVGGYEESGLTRWDYSQQMGIPVTTLDYYRRRQTSRSAGPLVRVRVLESERRTGFAVVMSNGRRIETSWDFAEEELARLVRVVEQA
jgi:hypothetical protein